MWVRSENERIEIGSRVEKGKFKLLLSKPPLFQLYDLPDNPQKASEYVKAPENLLVKQAISPETTKETAPKESEQESSTKMDEDIKSGLVLIAIIVGMGILSNVFCLVFMLNDFFGFQ
jgi:hypothetical protein